MKGNARSRASRTGFRQAAWIYSTEPMNWNWVTSSTKFRLVQALDPVQVALMDRIDSHVAGLPERLRPAAFPNRYLHGARGGRDRPAAPLVGDGVPQVVQVAVGDGGQAFEAGVTEAVEGAGAELPGGRAGEPCRGARRVRRAARCRWGCSGGGTVAGGAPRRSMTSPVVRYWRSRRVTWARDRTVSATNA